MKQKKKKKVYKPRVRSSILNNLRRRILMENKHK